MKIRERIDELSGELSGDSGAWGAGIEHDLHLLSYEVARATCEYMAANPTAGTDAAFAAALATEYAPPADTRMEFTYEGGSRHREGEVVDVLGDNYQVLEVKYNHKARRTTVRLRRTWIPA